MDEGLLFVCVGGGSGTKTRIRNTTKGSGNDLGDGRKGLWFPRR